MAIRAPVAFPERAPEVSLDWPYMHRQMIVRILNLPQKYISVSRDSVVCVWDTKTGRFQRSFKVTLLGSIRSSSV
jgi:glutathionyl-hydroquinone reductase